MSLKLILAFLMLSILASCSSLQYAGHASYSVRPFVGPDGSEHCCIVDLKNGKEIANLEARVVKQGNDFTIELKQQGVTAFEGQQIAAGATKAMIEATAKAAASAAIAQMLPALVPIVGSALSSPGLGAAAVGAGGVIAIDKLKGEQDVKPIP